MTKCERSIDPARRSRHGVSGLRAMIAYAFLQRWGNAVERDTIRHYDAPHTTCVTPLTKDPARLRDKYRPAKQDVRGAQIFSGF